MSTSMLIAMCVFFALAVPIAVSIGLAVIATIHVFDVLPPIIIGQQLYVTLDRFPLVAIPFFILAGNLMHQGGISRRLVEFARAVVGGVQGGLPAACVLTCMIFAAVSGSSTATTFAVGTVLIPAMVRAGYPVGWAAALQATAAELGVIIPPSIPLILYGVAADVSVGELFIAGFGPGLLIGLALIAYVLWTSQRKGWGKADGHGRQTLGSATLSAAWGLLMPVVVLGGIYGGLVTPTEASALAVFCALFIGGLIHRELTWARLWSALRTSVTSACVILFIIAWAGLMGFLINREGVTGEIGRWLVATLGNKWMFLIAVNLFLFVIGMFIETSAAIIILAPILTPVAVQFGLDPVHFGIVMVVNLAIGFITPPFGVNLFAACMVARIPLQKIIPPIVPFIGVVVACLAVVAFVPQIALALRDIVYR